MPGILAERHWDELRATARAHGLPFNTRWRREQAQSTLAGQLLAGGLRQCFRRLPDVERRALAVLQAAGGELPRHQFSRNFGTIRPCIQRRYDGTTGWPRPASVMERLWLLGLIEILPDRPERVVLPDETRALLPPLAAPQHLPVSQPETPTWSRADLCQDVVVLLGTLLREDVRPLHGRWLPPRVLHAVNRQLHSSPDHRRHPQRTQRRATALFALSGRGRRVAGGPGRVPQAHRRGLDVGRLHTAGTMDGALAGAGA